MMINFHASYVKKDLLLTLKLMNAWSTELAIHTKANKNGEDLVVLEIDNPQSILPFEILFFARKIKLWSTELTSHQLQSILKVLIWLLLIKEDQQWPSWTQGSWGNSIRPSFIGILLLSIPLIEGLLTWSFTLSIHKMEIQANTLWLGCFSESTIICVLILPIILTLPNSQIRSMTVNFHSHGTSETRCFTITKDHWQPHLVLRLWNGSLSLRFMRFQGRISKRSKLLLMEEKGTQDKFRHWTEEDQWFWGDSAAFTESLTEPR
jgi:hypothetical protein